MRKEVPVGSRIKSKHSNTAADTGWRCDGKKDARKIDARKMRTAMYNCRHLGALIKTRINPLRYILFAVVKRRFTGKILLQA